MIINMNGGSGGSSALNFKVVFSTTQPSASENTIWVKTSTAFGSWSMIDASTSSSITTNGHVVITYQASNKPSGTFNALKKNELYVKLTKCYQRVSSTWESLDAYVYVNGTWKQFSSVFKAYIAVTYPAGSTCTVRNGSVQLTAPNTTGSYTFTVPSIGTWTVSCTNGTDTATDTVTITAEGQSKSVSLTYTTIPIFTYDGEYEIVNDAGETITVSKSDWNIRLLTSGVLTFQDLKNASSGIDIFLVGGGGGGAAVGAGGRPKFPYGYGSGGGGAGYTKTQTNVSISTGTSYSVTIGAGGGIASKGGASSVVIGANTYSANGGNGGSGARGGAGGSGGGGGGYEKPGGTADGGTDGASGESGYNQYSTSLDNGGYGQQTTTRAFGENTGALYASGGGAGGGNNANTGANMSQGDNGGANPNTGDGGKGGGYQTGGGTATAGGSGIIIIRNHRTA